MQIGDAVQVTTGPFAGLRGLLKATGSRILITVELGARQSDVEMDLDWVAAAELDRRSAVGIRKSSSRVRGKGA